MNLTIATTAIAFAVGTSAGAGTAWVMRTNTINQIRLEQANERITIQRQARATLERTLAQVGQAQAAATSRAVVLRRSADAARGAADRVRESSASAVRAAQADAATCRAVAAAQGVILTESTGFIQEVVRDVEQCFSDLELIQDSWPKP